jgi:putrescine transport system ATP-binding protein
VGHGITGTAGMAVSVALRPEKIHLRRDPPAAREYNCMRGRVTDSGYFGSFSLYQVALGEGKVLKAQITHSERHGALLQRGDEVFATCESSAMVILKS